ncbi:hypothetical protein EJ02DRAFT_76818 [Clathrospora elynae]|uniref:Myb-like domain-containing protein n=1 Tax=Clathrospora elynae TaxID=706981 RepID=A0A6A5SAL1_9PLEO|nr:hypothetical protein EJ02DRAFT_76818 [Clathrospora elynae]
MTQLSPGSWMLLGYRCNDGALDLCNLGGLNAEWMISSHNDAASHGTDHSDDDWDKEDKNGEEVTEEYSQQTHKLWLESDEVLLLSLKDKQGMEWKDICKRFPSRSPVSVQDEATARGLIHERGVLLRMRKVRDVLVRRSRLQPTTLGSMRHP